MTVAVTPTLLWFRQDLRLQDNPALHAALARRGPILPVFVWDEAGRATLPGGRLESTGDGSRIASERQWPMGAAARWWLHHSLAALDESLRERGSRLVLARGEAGAVLRQLVETTGAAAVYWNRCYEPAAIVRDAAIQAEFTASGVETKSFNGSLLNEPAAIANRQGRPFQVYTAYWRQCLSIPVAAPLKLPAGMIAAPAEWPRSLALAELRLLPRTRWAERFAENGEPGEAAATRRLAWFVGTAMDAYDSARDLPDRDGTSRLSAALHFGELSPRQVWAGVKARSKTSGVFPPGNGARVFLAELGWREFAYHLLYHFPQTPTMPLREAFARFRWAEDPEGQRLRAWQRGRTGYPIIDAGMRQLWATGWMHNRVRMVVASFLVKHLRLPWTEGAAWFWDTLVDADLANNTLGWQWSAGCGADAAPYFRIFAPVLQGRKFDAAGAYVRRWVPELAGLPTKHLHAPWAAPAAELHAAGVRLGETYPHPIVDHATARQEALAAFQMLRASGRSGTVVTAEQPG